MALDERLAGFAVEREHDYLERVALRLVGRGADADDVVQEVWLEVLERPPRHTERFRAWLRLAASHAVARLRRGERRRRRREQAVARPEVGGADLVDSVAREGFLREVAHEIGRLDEPYRTVLRLRYLEELSAEEIAQRTGRSPATVRSQAKRGLERVRERLDRSFGSRETWTAIVLLRLQPRSALPAAKAVGIAAGFALIAIGTAWFVLAREARGTTPFVRSAIAAREASATEPVLAASTAETRVALPEPGAARGELAVRVLRSSDRSPLAREAVHVERLGVPGARAEWLETDGEGGARARLPAGSYRVQARRGELAIAEVPPGGTAEIELLLARGVPVHGTTVDPGRRPIAGAEVWLSLPDRPREAWRAAVSDRNGAFVLAEADPRGWVSARARDRLLSGAMSVGSAWDPAKDASLLELVLPDAVGRILARVVDARGEPVAGARVASHPQRTRVPYHDGRGVARAEGPLDVVETDARGRFELAAPDHPLSFLITAPGHPVWFGSLAHEEESLIQLEPPASLVGVVERPGHGPVPGARVTCAGRFPEDSRHALAGAGGHFRFDGLGSGRWRVSAEHDGGSDGVSLAGGALAEVELAPGESRELELELGTASAVRGRAIDEGGKPLAGCVVTIEPEWLGRTRGTHELVDDPGPRSARTDGQGGFAFQALDPLPHRLRLEVPGDRRGVAWTVVDGVVPGKGEVALVAPRPPAASVRGKLEPARPGSELFLRGRVLVRPLRAQLEEGAFVFAALPAGSYEIVAHRPGIEPFLVRTIELGPREELDLGAFALPLPGAAVMRLASPDAAPLEGLHVVLESPGGWRYATLAFPVEGISIDPRGEVRFADLAPGEHLVVIKVRGFADVFRSLAIQSDQTLVESVELERGLQIPVRVGGKRTLDPDSELHFALESERGTWRFTSRPSKPWEPDELLRYGLVLPPGEQHLWVDSDCGLSDSVVFDPAEIAGTPLVLRLE